MCVILKNACQASNSPGLQDCYITKYEACLKYKRLNPPSILSIRLLSIINTILRLHYDTCLFLFAKLCMTSGVKRYGNNAPTLLDSFTVEISNS